MNYTLSSLTARCVRGKPHPRFKGQLASFASRLLQLPKGRHETGQRSRRIHPTTLGEYLLKPLESEKPVQALRFEPQTSGYIDRSA